MFTLLCGFQVCDGGDEVYMDLGVLKKEHVRLYDAALDLFDGTTKKGGKEFSQKIRKHLEQEIRDAFIEFDKRNEARTLHFTIHLEI